MKTIVRIGFMAVALCGTAWAATDPNSTGYTSESGGAGYVSMDTAQPAATPEVADTQVAAVDKAKLDQSLKACSDALEKARKTGEDRLQHVADQKCREVDYTSVAPAAGPAQEEQVAENAPATALGADRRDQANYYPPENYKINGKEASWALTESFRQQMKAAGYDDNAIAAVGGNLQHESGMFYSNRWKWDEATGTHKLLTSHGALARGDKQNGVYTSFGIAQYHKDRGTEMLGFVGGKSLSPAGLQGTRNAQVAYLIQDLPKELKGNYAAFTNPNVSTETKTGIIVQKYERPLQVAGELYGRMGGRDRLKSALTIQTAMNSAIVPDTDSSNGTAKGGRPISNPNGSGSGGVPIAGNAGNGTTYGYTNGGGLGLNLTQANLLGLGGTYGVMQPVTPQDMLVAMIVSVLTNNGAGKVKDTPVDTQTEREAAEITRGYDLLKAMAKVCADDLSSSEDAKMLKLKICQGSTES